MISSSITRGGGVVVVTQVIPEGENSVLFQTPAAATAQQAPPTSPTSAAKVDNMTATFLRGQPHGLGVVQIFIGVLCNLLSLTAIFSELLMVYVPFCFAVVFVVSGSLTLAAGRRTSVALVWASLVSNMFSAMISLAGVVYLCGLLAVQPLFNKMDVTIRGNNNMWILDVVMNGLLSSVLVLLVLQLCVSITVFVFSGKAIRRQSREPGPSPFMVRVDDCHSLPSGVLEHGSNVALLGDYVEKSGLSPNTP
ncbi:membrane-spanning 4-domains subfamily A member 4D [Seriola aureovittata]|uniref:membrane-spanning 4-domains subfamily A member 4D n=1 Tax=Seriola aureovittata TaxID=2871759 RepID=UPI0024BF0A8C|nr:membrane-spanning 4-domains subfamily A member 4D [Seriola aureovittata]XP_056236889.1 membrane-spanning 4-domains subfamily A member 4D [Seriola aureovittata]